jgi:DNA ligase-1
MSRLGKHYSFLNNIRNDAFKILNSFYSVLDGELYSHDIPFNAISGAVRSTNKPSKYDSSIQFHIFDIILPENLELPYKDRIAILKCIEKEFDTPSLRYVYYTPLQDEKEIEEYHSTFVNEGYEGLMIRDLNSPYVIGRRVRGLLKYKHFIDTEYEIVDVQEGEGSEKGASIFVCQTKEGNEFTVRPRGSIEKRRIQYQNREKYIGKMLTVRYQNLSDINSNIPRFPVGIEVRDYE